MEPGNDRDGLHRELQRLRSKVATVWPMPMQLSKGYDVIYAALRGDLPSRIPWLPGQPEAALVLVHREGEKLDDKLLRNCAPQAVLHLPANHSNAYATLSMALRLFAYEKRLRDRIEKLDDNLKMTRQIERAKAIVMQKYGCSEKEAYDRMRSHAMEKRITISLVADTLVESQQILA